MYINLLRQRYNLHNLNIGQRQSNNSYCRDNKIHFINKLLRAKICYVIQNGLSHCHLTM